MPGKRRLFIGFCLLQLLTLLVAGSLTLFDMVSPSGTSEYVMISLWLGTIYAQSSIAAGWLILATPQLGWRLITSIGWVAGLSLAFTVGLFWSQSGPPTEMLFLAVGLVMAQFIVSTIGWGVIRWLFKTRLIDVTSEGTNTISSQQFKLAQLFVLTTIVAVLLAVGRGLLSQLDIFDTQGLMLRELTTFGVLLICAMLLCFPLLVAFFVGQRAWIGVVSLCLAIAVMTFFESLIFEHGISAPGPDVWHLVGMNLVTVLWLIAFGTLGRWSGLRLQICR